MVDFAPASEVVPGRYDSEEVFNTVLPHLKQLKAAGGHSLVECTPNFLARDPALLRRLSESSGIHLVTNTGLYKEPHLPQFALEETEDELVERWVKEAEEGLDGTGIRHVGQLDPLRHEILSDDLTNVVGVFLFVQYPAGDLIGIGCGVGR